MPPDTAPQPLPTPIQADPLRGLPHGFFTRQGGVSSGIYDSLNGGQGSDDRADAVAQNRALVAAALGAGSLVTVHQVHSPDAVHVTAPLQSPPRADALVTKAPGLAIAILTADCTPVLFADHDAGVVGAAHAGWKGALGGVLEATLDAMEDIGADRMRISAVLGPVISQRAYEVGPEFVERFLDDDADNAQFFAAGKDDRAQFDLPSFALARLRGAGIGAAEWTGHCTYSDPARFYSYRRSCHQNEPDYGRLIAAIAVPED